LACRGIGAQELWVVNNWLHEVNSQRIRSNLLKEKVLEVIFMTRDHEAEIVIQTAKNILSQEKFKLPPFVGATAALSD